MKTKVSLNNFSSDLAVVGDQKFVVGYTYFSNLICKLLEPAFGDAGNNNKASVKYVPDFRLNLIVRKLEINLV